MDTIESSISITMVIMFFSSTYQNIDRNDRNNTKFNRWIRIFISNELVRVEKRGKRGGRGKTRDPRGFWMTLLLQGWEDCLEKGTRARWCLSKTDHLVYREKERERDSRREKKRREKKREEVTLSQIKEEGLLFTISRMQSSSPAISHDLHENMDLEG